MTAAVGVYDDALRVKKNTLCLFLLNLFGGLAPGGVAHLTALSKRGTDRTTYLDPTCREFRPFWGQRLSAAVVTADARRCLQRLPGLQAKAVKATLERMRKQAAAAAAQ